MSNLTVQRTTIHNVRPHPNADRLDIAEVLGWQTVTQKGQYQGGEQVIYFPPDTVLPVERVEEFGITSYVQYVKDEHGEVIGGRLRSVKLRGEPSYGLVMPLPDGVVATDSVFGIAGTDFPEIGIAEYYGATKYRPPLRAQVSDAEPNPHPMFLCYTEIEDLRNYPEVLSEGEAVVITEKIDGTNCRVGQIEGMLMIGSKGVQRQIPRLPDSATIDFIKGANNLYAYPLTRIAVLSLIERLGFDHDHVIIFGEVYGRVQTLKYGLPNGLGFRAFDIMVGGKYMDYLDFRHWCSQYGVETVPQLYVGPYSLQTVQELSRGKTEVSGKNIKEGVVVRPVRERQSPITGRVILKYLSDDYLTGNHPDYTDQ